MPDPLRALPAAALTLLLAAGCTSQPASRMAAPGEAPVRVTARTAAAEDWSRFLPALYPAIVACLAANPSPPAYATDVVPMNRGLVTVFTMGFDGQPYGCVVGSLGGRPEINRPMAEPPPLLGPAFIPATLREPADACLANEPVTDRTGAVLGWVSYRDC